MKIMEKNHNKGGRRAGAGRPKGAASLKTREIANRAVAEGITPLEYLLLVMRDENASPPSRLEAAKSAAPYVHPRLSAVDVSSKDGTMTPKAALDVSKLSSQTLAEIMRAADVSHSK